MITNGEVAAMIVEHYYVIGHPLAFTFMEHVTDSIEVYEIDLNAPLLYQGNVPAYCKYCYTTHRMWRVSNDHWPPCWICEHCNHAMRDEFMEIE